MVQLRLLRQHHHHVLHLLLHDDYVQHHRRDHVMEILRLLTRPHRGCLAVLPHFLPCPHGRLHNHLHHLATDSHPLNHARAGGPAPARNPGPL